MGLSHFENGMPAPLPLKRGGKHQNTYSASPLKRGGKHQNTYGASISEAGGNHQNTYGTNDNAATAGGGLQMMHCPSILCPTLGSRARAKAAGRSLTEGAVSQHLAKMRMDRILNKHFWIWWRNMEIQAVMGLCWSKHHLSFEHIETVEYIVHEQIKTPSELLFVITIH